MKTIEQVNFLCTKDRELLKEIKTLIQQFLPTATVLLYGSVARGTREPESDYDILILTEGPLTSAQKDEIDDAVYDLQLLQGTLLATTFRTKADWNARSGMPFHLEVQRDGIVL